MSISIVNPHILDFIETITREVYSSGYQAGRITTTGSTYQTAATVSTTESSGTNYAAFWQATGDNSGTTTDFRARLFETSERQFSNIEPQDATDALSVGGMYPYAGGTNKTHQIQYASEAVTAGVAGRALNVLALDSSDKWAFNSGSTNSTANAVSVTITEAGEYLVIGSGMLGAADNAVIFDGTNSYGAVGLSMNQDATTFSPFWHIVKLSLTNETLSVRITTGTIRQASILALKLDKFENVYYSEQTTQQTTTSNTFVDAFTYQPTLVNPGNYHLVLGCAQLQSSSTNQSAGAKLTNQSRGTNYNVAHFRENNNTSEWYPTVVARRTTFVDPSPTLAWEFYSEANNTARLRNMAIAVLDTGIPAPPPYFIAATTVVDSSSITLSDQIEEGDIVVVAGHSTSVSVATPTGYTAGQSGVSNTVNYNWSYKIQGATPDTIADGLTTGANVKYIAMVFRYVDTTNPIETTATEIASSSGMPDSGSVTTANPSIILSIGFLDDDNVVVDTAAPGGYSLCGVEQSSGTLMGAYKIQSAAGTEDPGAFGGSGTDTWVAATIALRLA